MTQHKNSAQGHGLNLAAIKENREGATVQVTGAPESTALDVKIPETILNTVSKEGNKINILDPTEVAGNISIRPYIEGGMENMGLEKYNFAVFPGTAQSEQLAAVERNGVVRYITGLNEYAPEVIAIQDAKQKEAVILSIRTIVSDLEKRLASNMIKVDDPEFWNKVTLLKPDNHDYWSKVSITCGNEPIFLNPKEDPEHLVKFMAIEAGGFDLIAKSYEDAQSMSKPPKFYLDKEVDTVSTRTQYKKVKNIAISKLVDIFTKNPKKLLYITKALETFSSKYKNSTPIDILYDVMDEYIQGNGVETHKMRAAENFIKSVELDMETLKLKSLIKDASFYKLISVKSDGAIYHTATNTMLGKNVSNVLQSLKNPLHEDVLKALLQEVDQYWNS